MRLDQYLVEKGMVETRSKASDLIKRKMVTVDGQIAKKTGLMVHDETVKIIKKMTYVGRGGEKLAGAIDHFELNFKDKMVIDVGASTGGFTDVCLTYGAKHVYAYDVGIDQLAQSLREDQRVSVFEATNFLDVNIPDADIIVIDVSFISITKILAHIKEFNGIIVGLIKPQFEVGPTKMKHGVLKDKHKHQKILEQVILYANQIGLSVVGLMSSTLKGKKGNQEYIIVMNPNMNPLTNIEDLIGEVTC